MNTMLVLCEKGELEVKWDSSSEASIAEARSEVLRLKEYGYVFFLVGGAPADDFQAAMADGRLVCKRRLEPDEVTQPLEQEPVGAGRRGRKPKKDKTVVATKQMGGG